MSNEVEVNLLTNSLTDEVSPIKGKDLLKSVKIMDEYKKLVQQVESLPSLKEIEKAYIMQVIGLQDGNVKTSAKILGLSIKGLYNRLHSFGYNFNKGDKKNA